MTIVVSSQTTRISFCKECCKSIVENRISTVRKTNKQTNREHGEVSLQMKKAFLFT